MSELKPLIPEAKLIQLIDERIKALNLSQRRIAAKLDIPQSQISRSLNAKRGLRYDELQKMIDYILSLESLIHLDLRAIEIAVPVEELKWVYDEDSVGGVVGLMFEGGFSQIPIKDRAKNDFIGVVSDLGILKAMLLPASGRIGVVSLSDLREKSVKDSNIIEAITDCHPDTPLNAVANLLVHFPALLLRDDLGDVKGIITRADLLKLL